MPRTWRANALTRWAAHSIPELILELDGVLIFLQKALKTIGGALCKIMDESQQRMSRRESTQPSLANLISFIRPILTLLTPVWCTRVCVLFSFAEKRRTDEDMDEDEMIRMMTQNQDEQELHFHVAECFGSMIRCFKMVSR
jgi:hypothetical protein